MGKINEQQIKLQIEFSRLHVYLLGIFMIYILEQFTQNEDGLILKSLLILIPLMIIEIVFKSCKFFGNIKVILLFRFAEVCITSVFMYFSKHSYTFGILLLLLLLCLVEFLASFEILDTFYRNIAIILACIPIFIGLISNLLVRSKGDKGLFAATLFTLILIIIISNVTNIYSMIGHYYDEKVYEQSRLISNANALNEDLRINQEKVKRANELLGIQKIQLEAAYVKINYTNTEMMIQNEIVKYISSSLEIGKLMTLITESILNEMGVDICAIMLNPGVVANKRIEYKIRTNLSNKVNLALSNAIEEGRLDEYLYSKKTYVDNQVDINQYEFIKEYKTNSLLILPLIKEEEQIGALLVGHPKIDYFVDNTLFYEAIVSQFLIALNNANLYLKMENMAIHDSLTGIYNRGHLTELFNEYMNEAIINRMPLSAALFDIDKFKNVNDTYGHLFGDEVIKTIANIANEIAEENNSILGRYGGEEFVVIFPNKSLEDTYEIVKELHNRIKTKELFYKGKSVFINISIGITSYPQTCMNPANLLNRADWAMYYAKQNGRGQITIDSDSVREEVMLI